MERREPMERLNHYCQKRKLILSCVDVRMDGQDHDPLFTVSIKLNDDVYGTGSGKTKKEAKAAAAKITWEMVEKKMLEEKMLEKQLESPSSVQAAESMTNQVTLSSAPNVDYVSLLNVYSQRTLQIVDYPNKSRTGNAHTPIFFCSCTVSGFVYGSGTGTSLAAAKQAAAKQAIEELDKQGIHIRGFEKTNNNSTFTEHSNSPQVPTQSGLSNSSICFEDSSAKLVGKMKNMAVCENPSRSQRHAQSSALKPKRKLAANFDNARNKEEEEKMSDSDESVPDLDTNTSEKNGSPYTVNKRLLETFTNIECIGEGGFGNVFKATAKLDERTYAVKRVHFTKNVKREVKELARLDHENIVRYYCSWKGFDHVTYPDSRQKSDEVLCLFIQMEFCEQGTLDNWIEKNRQDRKYHEMAQNKFLQILEGVKYIHSEGLIHRDLKPQNLFISREDKIKIGDFGLVTSAANETLTENRGTKSYMAPEQFGDSYGKEVDIYALGLIWFEILAAYSCHEKTKIWHDVRKGQLPEGFTNQFLTKAPIIKKMLSKQASARYSASEILKFFKSAVKTNSRETHTQ
ncbi:interferon-induced, double-stranded RNA-activated protein kinase [Falco biarmicus]|uniref:interferon-induced, double-stranded RNA-activated protein kinase n=1 Tax=Falco biarmicus TaxID=345155 RepID=UPI0006794206|nr:interferon-induced, double-stranded RNA-activated protein kinase isoform X1 [Falco cherrug]XP_037261316.1 interferon-induced, double-stranded RNA-activated protein kinase isoform X1 [Falco rusticolus]XP_037261317.1 interferon-induced, double-stranded RNA-activated protein kinase isoform X1 [Falco rusticolus]XP_037261318.1 interferon-induced, double-stranded RNA-activated protein kinase isoform X1 [Falco rusticolus]XP_037261319.1 interferon-induced, double-stranded RNA-activated protein kinas